MAAKLTFLQGSVDDTPKTSNAGSGRNTDHIRQMLREQQRSMGALHANALFREFRGDGQKKAFGKGYVAVADTAERPMIDDFQAEGQARMFDLIRQTAVKDEKPLRGVWASFGKPYICLGEPADPDNRLPKLYRDELAQIEGSKHGKGAKGKKAAQHSSQQQGGQQQQQAQGTQGQGAPPPGSPGGVGEGQAPGASGNQSPARSPSGRRIGTATSMASMESNLKPDEVMELRLGKSKTVMRFTNADVAETQFPAGPLRLAAQRRKMSQAKPGNFVNVAGAEAEASDPFLAYGQLSLPKKVLKPITTTTGGGKGRVSPHQDSGDKFFITQGGGGHDSGHDGMQQHRISQTGHRQSMAGYYGDGGGDDDGSEGAGAGPGINPQGGPNFQAISTPAYPMKGDEDNPVYSWHNQFLKVRQEGRAALQQALWERAEGRFRARTVGPMAANLSSILMADLDMVRGKQMPYATAGLVPESPYVKMDASWAALQARAQTAARAAQTLDPEELRVLQRFYDQLCALVEAQRMSDPLSLMVIHKVKSLLEGGTFLQREMLSAVLEHLAKFMRSTGIIKYNKYMLSILTFISKCTGVVEAEFEDMIQNEAGLSMVVYNMPYPPSRMPAQVYDTIPEDELMSPTTRLKSRAHARGGGGGGGRGAPLGALASAVSQAAHAAQGSGEAGGPTSMSGAAGGGGGGGAASARSPYSDEAHRDNLEKSVTSASLTPRDKVETTMTAALHALL